jgi:hypothetical protein
MTGDVDGATGYGTGVTQTTYSPLEPRSLHASGTLPGGSLSVKVAMLAVPEETQAARGS